jgi:hypothetical protein
MGMAKAPVRRKMSNACPFALPQFFCSREVMLPQPLFARMPRTTCRKNRFVFQAADVNSGWINLYTNGYHSASLLVWSQDENERENNG